VADAFDKVKAARALLAKKREQAERDAQKKADEKPAAQEGKQNAGGK